MKTARTAFVLVVLAISPGAQLPIHAQTISDFQSREFTSPSGDTLRYRLLVPENYDSSRSYPIVMFLHGGQQRGKARWTAATACGARFCGVKRRQEKHPCFVFVPHAPQEDNWGSVFEGGPSRTLLAAMEALDALENEFNIDKRREYITGLSGGGKGTWVAFLSHPGRFAAAIPLCARQSVKPEEVDLTNYARMAKELPLWLWHGAKDQKNEVANSRLMFRALQNVGANAKYTEVRDAPHNCWDAAYSSDELHDWLFAQSLPMSVSVDPAARARRRDAVTKSNPWRVEARPSSFRPRTSPHPSRGTHRPGDDKRFARLPDISTFITSKSDTFLVDIDQVMGGHPFKGRRAHRPHSGAHVYLGNPANTWPKGGTAPANYPPIYAAVDGFVTGVTPTFRLTTGADRYGVDIAFARDERGSVYRLFCAIEPFVPEPSKDFYKPFIVVSEGQEVKKGDIIAYMYTPPGQINTHICFRVQPINGGHMAPVIFTREVAEAFHAKWKETRFRYDGNDTIPPCLGYKLTAEENPLGTGPLDAL